MTVDRPLEEGSDAGSGEGHASARRREFLAAAGGLGVAGLAGCLGLFETESLTTPPVLDDRPDAVYFPTHVEGMKHATTVDVGEYRLALLYSYAHRFWTVSGTDRTKKPAEKDVHLMATLFDPDTETVVSDTGLSMAVERDGDLVAQETVYRMLSQRMGFHYGANFPLDGDGTYDVQVTVGAVDESPRLTGAFEGSFAEPRTASVPFEYTQAERDDIAFENTEDRAGERAATDAMSMGTFPNAVAPSEGALPGRTLGTGSHADAEFVATLSTDAFADRMGAGDDEAYLLVSPRTPHNRMVLPRMGLSATVDSDGTTFDGRLTPTLDHEADYHYGAVVPATDPDTTGVTVSVETPPQVARHEGYETAFLDSGTASLTR